MDERTAVRTLSMLHCAPSHHCALSFFSLDLVLTVCPVNSYLKVIDKFFNNYISCFMTGGNVKFLLLHQPPTAAGGGGGAPTRNSTSVGANPTSPQTEEAIKNFFTEVYENYVKAIMSPFYKVNMEIRSPVFRQRVMAAGRKYL